MKKLKNKHLDKCMKTILDHMDEYDMWSDNDFVEYCKDADNVNALYTLQAQDNIRVEVSNCEPEYIALTDIGRLYFINKENSRKEFAKSFFNQFATGFLSGGAVAVISTLLVQYLEKQ